MLKADDGLLDAVLENGEVIFGQILDQAVAVEHGGIEDNFFHILAKDVAAAFLADFVGRGRGRGHPASAPGRGPRTGMEPAAARTLPGWAFFAL